MSDQGVERAKNFFLIFHGGALPDPPNYHFRKNDDRLAVDFLKPIKKSPCGVSDFRKG